MDYPVLSHYDPSVTDETAGSGGDEQELLCEFSNILDSICDSFLFLFGVKVNREDVKKKKRAKTARCYGEAHIRDI